MKAWHTMLNRLPKRMPSFGDMLADLGSAHPRDVAKALGVNPGTVRRWIREGDAPRPAALALFWVTRWGQQWADADLFNLAQVHMGLSAARLRELEQAQAEIERLREQISRLGRLGEFGSANDPVQGATGPGPVKPAPVPCPSEPLLTFSGFESTFQKQSEAPARHEHVPRFNKRQARAVARSVR